MDTLELISDKTRELRELVSTIDRNSSVPIITVLKTCSQISGEYCFDDLTSRTKQYSYLVMLLLESNGCCDFTMSDFDQICRLLNEIESLYRQVHDSDDEIIVNQISDNQKKSMIAQSCYASKHFNTTLLYKEQEIDRIERIFTPFDCVIVKEIQLKVKQILDFYIETEQILNEKYESALNDIFSVKNNGRSFVFYTDQGDAITIPVDSYKDFLISCDDYSWSDREVAKKLLKQFSLSVENGVKNNNLRFYCQYDNNYLEEKPILEMQPEGYFVFDSNLLIVAIYNFLSGLHCISKGSLSKSKARAIEEKIQELFNDNFSNGTSFSNFSLTPKGSEHDFLYINGSTAIVVECKSDIQRKYGRDTNTTYATIERDFKSSIQKGYAQAVEVAFSLSSSATANVYSKDSSTVIGEINCQSIEEIHVLIVTQERYALLQNDLDLLLECEGFAATSICVDDLETELITFNRLDSPFASFCEYLTVKETLHSRVLYDDELDLAAYFLQERELLKNMCNDNNIYAVKEDYSALFDYLYYNGGLGFKKELYYPNKLMISEDGIELYETCKRIGLKLHPSFDAVYEQYKKDNSIT